LLRHDVCFDRQFVYADMSQNHGNVELNNKKEDDDKKKKNYRWIIL